MSLENSFWEDKKKAAELLKEKSIVESNINNFEKIEKLFLDTQASIELLEEENSEDLLVECNNYFLELEQELKSQEIELMLSGDNDRANAILCINAGAGGTEAQDWAEMLLRMYLRYCERRKWKTQIVDTLSGEGAGIKSATITITGDYAYGYLKAENGVHRLVRISPFDANARRHTSFAAIFVYPDVEDSIEIVIEDKDIRIDTYRAGGKGGQKVNKTDSAVRITHIPTGIVVQCQNERSQHQNKDTAMKILRARLYERELMAKKEKQQMIEDSKKEIAWGSQIRSYILQPYRMVKDHRTGVEVGDVDRVLDGDIQNLIEAYLLQTG